MNPYARSRRIINLAKKRPIRYEQRNKYERVIRCDSDSKSHRCESGLINRIRYEHTLYMIDIIIYHFIYDVAACT